MDLSHVLDRWQQAFVADLGRTVVPATPDMPGYSEASQQRLRDYLAELAPAQRSGVHVALAAVQAALGRRRDPAGLAAGLDRLATTAAGRLLLHTALMPLKVNHYAGPEAYAAMGLPFVAPPSPHPSQVRPGVLAAADLGELEREGVDVVVVGSGAGGAVVAAELAARGVAVLVVEEGAWFDRRDFAGPAHLRSTRMYRNAALLATVGNPPIFLPVGRTVGGTTTVNSGTCFRAQTRILERWAGQGLPELAPQRLDERFARVEAVLRVTPASPRYVGEVGRIIAQGCDALGLEHGPLPRNAPECDGQGQCAAGCPTEAKRSTEVSYLPLALQRGAALLPQTQVIGVECAGAQVRGVRVRHLPTGQVRTIAVKHLVVAAGSLHTPGLLRAAGVHNPNLGANLSIHPVGAAYAAFDRPTQPLTSIPQGYGIDAFAQAGLLFEGGTVAPELTAGALPLRGPNLQEAMHGYGKMANFGFLVEDKGRGRVLGRLGDLPVVHYPLAPEDAVRLHRGLLLLASVFLEAGARWVRPLLYHDVTLRSQADVRQFSAMALPNSSLQLSAYHPLGTARMARYARDGVCDPRGRVHGARNLWVADGSLLPSSPGVNPQVTIMALADLVAEALADELGAQRRKNRSRRLA